MDPVKISSLELSNVKRIRALQLEPTESGLTIIGGDNAQGKTSVLDAIAWALGGNKRKPDNPTRDGAATPAKLHVELSNGITVERRGKNGVLYVTDTTGMKGTQRLLDEFLSQLAIDLPKFMGGTDKERTDALLRTLGIDQQLAALDLKIQNTFDERRDAARVAKKDKAYADSLPHHEGAPDEPVSISELIQQQQDILARNAENQRKREHATQIEYEYERAKQTETNLSERIASLMEQVEQLTEDLDAAKVRRNSLEVDLLAATQTTAKLEDESTAEIEASIADIENINRKVQDNQQWERAHALAKESAAKQRKLDAELKELRQERVSLLDGAPLPLEGLSINDDGVLTYNGQTWGDMSGAERLRVSTAIVHATKPECGFVLVDELERLDTTQLAEFATWAEGEGLQVIGTRVAKDDACTVIIEDGRIVGQDAEEPTPPDPRGTALDWEPKKETPAEKPQKTWGGASF